MPDCPWIGHEVRLISNLIKRHVDMQTSQKQTGEMTNVQMWMIGYLVRMERAGRNVCQRDAEKEFGIRRSTATGILQGLEKRGLITRLPVAHDGRLKRLVLTDAAREMHRDAMDDIAQLEKVMREGIGEDEIAVCLSVLRRVRQNIERADNAREHARECAE